MYRKRHYRDEDKGLELTAKANEAVIGAIIIIGGNYCYPEAYIEPFNPDEPIDKRDIEAFIGDSDESICATCVYFHFEDVTLDYYQAESLVDEYNELKSIVADKIRDALRELL